MLMVQSRNQLRRSRFSSTVVVTAVLTMMTVAEPAVAAPPPTAAAAQLAWVLTATAHPPVPDAELRAHLSASFLTGVGGDAQVNAVFATVGPLVLDYAVHTTATVVEAVTSGPHGQYVTELELDGAGLIDALGLDLEAPAPASWAQVDEQLHSLAPQVSFTASRITTTGTCTPIHALSADIPRPLGSAFKLYVLGALGRAVAAHTAAWNTPLAIRNAWKSLPSGILQNEPPGTVLPLQQYADDMISISDNTAADHLIHFLGRGAVEQQLTAFGNSDPALTIPFPTTRELFTLKSFYYPAFTDLYLASPPLLRPVELAVTAAVPLTALSAWTQPENINQLEWFGSADDMCRALAGLWQQAHTPGLAPIATALSINDGGLALNPAQDPTVWFKGGSEPGVLTLNYLIGTADGAVVVVSVLLSNPASPINETTAAPAALAIIRGAITLAR